MGAPKLSPPTRHDAAWVADALNRADAILAAPPVKGHTERAKPQGHLVARFVLPLDLCAPQNRTRHGRPWELGRMKHDVLVLMLVQHRPRRQPLPGRPFVRCVRFSSVEPDKYADWAKLPVDRLTAKSRGLGFLRDDRPGDCEIHQGWEHAKNGQGFVLVEVWTGEVTP